MFRQLKNNNRGIVFVTVLALIVVMMVLTISVLSMNIGQVTNAEKEVRRIKAEASATGMVAYVFANQQTQDYTTATQNYTNQKTIDSSLYQMNATLGGANSAPNLTVTVNY